jgi:hypothetical protein
MKSRDASLAHRTRRRFSQPLAILVALVLLASQITATPQARRIKFKPGATTATVTGQLNGWNDKARFVIRLRAGQTMNLSVEGKCDGCNPDVVVDSPAGAQDTVDADMCQCRVEVSHTAAGDYRISVGENRKGEKWKGSFVLKVKVI